MSDAKLVRHATQTSDDGIDMLRAEMTSARRPSDYAKGPVTYERDHETSSIPLGQLPHFGPLPGRLPEFSCALARGYEYPSHSCPICTAEPDETITAEVERRKSLLSALKRAFHTTDCGPKTGLMPSEETLSKRQLTFARACSEWQARADAGNLY